MRFILQLVTIIVLGLILESFFPWWSIAIAAFIAGYLVRSNANFLAGFFAVTILWVMNAWLMDVSSTAYLTNKVAAIFQLPNKTLLYIVMAVVGGLVGGFAALTGSLAKKKE